jgi:hypothetical protein
VLQAIEIVSKAKQQGLAALRQQASTLKKQQMINHLQQAISRLGALLDSPDPETVRKAMAALERLSKRTAEAPKPAARGRSPAEV